MLLVEVEGLRHALDADQLDISRFDVFVAAIRANQYLGPKRPLHPLPVLLKSPFGLHFHWFDFHIFEDKVKTLEAEAVLQAYHRLYLIT